MFYAYILQSQKNGRLYVGSTGDLKRRFAEHNKGSGSMYTKKNMPFTLIFYEAYMHKKDAQDSERFYKSGYGREVLKDKLKNYLAG